MRYGGVTSKTQRLRGANVEKVVKGVITDWSPSGAAG
jgi:hypothetical protein